MDRCTSSHSHHQPSSTILVFLLLLNLVLVLSSDGFIIENNYVDDLRLSSSANFPKIEAEKLIKHLNLSPKRSFNHRAAHEEESSPAAGAGRGRLIERSFKIPPQLLLHDHGIPGTSLQDFGHHAGYYRLPHSKDARSLSPSLMLTRH
ncbi:hypothetical protein Dimus_019531 [Dionaea muscipula]